MAPLLLVVDDEPTVAFIVGRLGRQAGYETADCGDVPEAWEYLQRFPYSVLSTQYSVPGTASPRRPDLVLLDVNLPGTPGPELCRRIRATPRLADLRIAVFTQWDRVQDPVAGLAAGADFVVSKDTLSPPEAWSARLQELFSWSRGRTVKNVLNCPGPQPSAEDVFQALNPALCRALPRHAAAAVLPVLAERALQTLSWWEQTSGVDRRTPPCPQPLTTVPDGWLLPTGLGLDPGRLAPARPGAVTAFAVALVEQLECVVGTAAAAPARAALAPLLGP